MQKIIESLKVPFRRGKFIGTLDILFRLLALTLYLWFVKTLCLFAWDAVFNTPIPAARAWWLLYCVLSLGVATILAYTAIYDRE